MPILSEDLPEEGVSDTTTFSVSERCELDGVIYWWRMTMQGGDSALCTREAQLPLAAALFKKRLSAEPGQKVG